MSETTADQEDGISNIFDVEVPVPTAEGKLLSRSDDWHHNVYLHAGSWDAYAESYKRAADQLVQDVVEGRLVRSEADFVALPVIFLYRQSLELRLKELATEYGGVPVSQVNTHTLSTVWRHVRPLLEAHFGASEYDDIIENRVKEWDDLDPGSYAFRYPVKKSGEPFRSTNENVDLRQLQEIMAGIASYLDGASTGLYEHRQAQSEYYQYYYDQADAGDYYQP